ncbi:MAG TPA: HPr family phosphocarrier protein [Vicinamibacterales bacterium]|jgi:phosphocarrier protein HPr|nr:HPr family phosphocarrier protein [Vicinamibacterales bacterium]
MVSRTVTITNALGMHARAAARFVHAATAFRSQVRVVRGNRVTDGKSIMGILLLAASRGTALIITADGPDEHEALEALCSLVETGLGEEPWSA